MTNLTKDFNCFQFSEKDVLVLKIISDAVLFERISESLYNIVNAVNLGEGNNFTPEQKYNGIKIAIEMMGCDSEELRNNMLYCFSDICHEIYDVEPCILAQQIFFKWTLMIKDFYTTTKKAS